MRNRLLPLLFGGDGGASALSDAGLLVFRLFVGLALAFGHGVMKLPPSAGFVETTAGLGFPAPAFFAWCAGLAEFAGGLCLAVGLLTRPAALAVAFTMAVAAFGRHGGGAFSDQETALLYLVAALMLLLTGSGRFGLDRLIRPRRDDRIWR